MDTPAPADNAEIEITFDDRHMGYGGIEGLVDRGA
jgi:hypothetical protein